MDWILITTKSRSTSTLQSNVGDEFAYLGVRKLILTLDKFASIVPLDKEASKEWDRLADRAIICGMPLFWSFDNQTQNDIWWFPKLMQLAGRMSTLALGVGTVLLEDAPLRDFRRGMRIAAKTLCGIFTRDGDYGFDPVICPSAFAMMDRASQKGTRKLCNFMPLGGHLGLHTPHGQVWDGVAPEFAAVLIQYGFEFVAHTQDELLLALKLGWMTGQIHCFHSAEEYLDLYATAEMYVGNRVHGAAVVAAIGRPALAVTHDSRIEMVERIGGCGMQAKNLTVDGLKAWISNPPPSAPKEERFSVPNQWEHCLALVKEFAG